MLQTLRIFFMNQATLSLVNDQTMSSLDSWRFRELLQLNILNSILQANINLYITGLAERPIIEDDSIDQMSIRKTWEHPLVKYRIGIFKSTWHLNLSSVVSIHENCLN